MTFLITFIILKFYLTEYLKADYIKRFESANDFFRLWNYFFIECFIMLMLLGHFHEAGEEVAT